MSHPPARSADVQRPADEIRIRPMRIADLDALLPFEQAMFGPESWSRQSYLDELADTVNRYYIVAEAAAAGPAATTPADRGIVLGSGGLLVIGDTAQIMTVGVRPDRRRAGVGRRLVRQLIAEARRRRAVEVLLEVRVDNPAAQQLYRSEGFETIGRRPRYYDGGRVDGLSMRLDLSSPRESGR